ncbi:hypothetical protein CPB86DRAFT_859145 [Serendipita vermifera]|nr:hypothetical protein CPB86DRAFT_859145 [Serendipita vermifera]
MVADWLALVSLAFMDDARVGLGNILCRVAIDVDADDYSVLYANFTIIVLNNIDGGGPRSLSQLEILRSVMHKVQCDSYPNEPDKVILPCEYFHMMGGSDTGGLLVVMLTKLRMTVDEAIEEFREISKEVYEVEDLTPSARSQKLRECLENLLKKKDIPLDATLVGDRGENDCAGFVVAKPKSSVTSKILLRTYKIRTEPPSKISIVDACLATCASQLFLPVIQSSGKPGAGGGGREFVGAGLGASNPIREVILEAHSLFSGADGVAAIISIGAGHPGTTSFPDPTSPSFGSSAMGWWWGSKKGMADSQAWLKTLTNMINDCEETAREIKTQMGHLGLYWRFSVEQGLQQAAISDEDEEAGEWIMTQTRQYLESEDVVVALDACADALKTQLSLTTLEQLQYSGGGQAVYKGLPALSRHFVMRDEPWKQIVEGILPNIPYSEKAEPGPLSEQRIMVISGLGGCGKTQLVTKLAHEYRDKYDHIFFVDGSSLTSLRADLIAHVRSVSSEYSQAMFKEAMSFLCNPAQPNWLVVYDNVDDVNLDMTPYLPQCSHGSIIITTRNRSLGTLATDKSLHISLDVMSPAEATESILKSAQLEQSEKKNQEAAGAIAKELGCLPVALIQAGCYIFEAQCSCEEYLGLLRKYRLEMMDAPAADRQRRSAYATFDISYKRLQPHLQKFLHMLSFCHYANFPMAVIPYAAKSSFTSEPFRLVDHGEEFDSTVALLKEIFFLGRDDTSDDRTVHQITTVLQKYSLASFVPASGSLLLQRHPLAHLWAYDRLTPEQRVKYKAAATRLVVCGSGEAILERYLVPHIDSLLSTEETVPIAMNDLAEFASILGRMGRGKDTQRIWLGIYKKLTDMYGSDDLNVANAALQLSGTYEGELNRMEELMQQGVDIREKQLGKDHYDTLIGKGSLSGTYVRQGRYEKARELREEVLEAMKRTLGPTNLETLKCMGHLAWIHSWQGQYQKAEVLEVEVLAALREQLGDSHNETLEAMHNLGLTYFSQGKYYKAEEIQLQVYEERKEKLGSIHPQTLNAIRNLSLTYHALGMYAKAETIQVPAVKELRDESGETQATMAAKEDLAVTYQWQGRFAEAEALQLQVLKGRQQQLGESHPDTLKAMTNLAFTYHQMTNYPKAEELKLENLRLQREQHGDFHRSTINAMSDLALTYQYQSRHAEAEALQVKVLEGTRAIIGEKHHETLNAMESLGYTYQLLGRYKEAEELHKVVYRERSEQMGPDQPHTLISMGHLGSIYFSQGRYAEAEEMQLKVLNGRREKLGSKHSYTLIAMGHLAVTYCSQGRYKESEALHKEVLEARIEELGEDHSDTLAAMSHVANIYRMQWRFEEAEELQRKMVKSRSAALGENHLATLTDKSQLASTFLSEGLYEEAESLQVEVLEGRMERLGEKHPETVDAKATLIEIRRVQRRFTEAEGLAHDVYMDRKNRLGDNHPDTALTMQKNLPRRLSKPSRSRWEKITGIIRAIKPS